MQNRAVAAVLSTVSDEGLCPQVAQPGGVRAAAPDGGAEGPGGLRSAGGRAGLGQTPQPPAPRRHR